MKRYTATFSNGKVITSPPTKEARTHGWYACGRLASGKTWWMSGFSKTGEANARKAISISTSHLRKTAGVTFDIAEVAPATALPESTEAAAA